MQRERAQAILTSVVEMGRRADAEVVVRLAAGHVGHTRFGRGEVTSTAEIDNATLTVTCALGQRHCTVSSNQLDDSSLRALVESAIEGARISPEDPEWMSPLPQQEYAKASSHDASAAQIDARWRAEKIAEVIQAGSDRDLQTAGFLRNETVTIALATSRGLWAWQPCTEVAFSTTFRTRDGTGSGWSASRSQRASDIHAASLAAVAIKKALRSRDAARLDAGRYTLVMEPEAVADLMGVWASSLDQRAADEGRSYFSRTGGGILVGEKLFPEWMTIRSDPSDAQTPALTFDDEGLPQHPITWVRGGVQTRLSCNRYWAKKSGVDATPAPSSLILEGGAGSTDDLVRRVQRGLLVTRLWYIRSVDPQTMLMTGLTRDGLFLIEDGNVTSAVRNFRFNESPATMLRNAEAASAPVRIRAGMTGWKIPALLTHDFHLASQSDAI